MAKNNQFRRIRDLELKVIQKFLKRKADKARPYRPVPNLESNYINRADKLAVIPGTAVISTNLISSDELIETGLTPSGVMTNIGTFETVGGLNRGNFYRVTTDDQGLFATEGFKNCSTRDKMQFSIWIKGHTNAESGNTYDYLMCIGGMSSDATPVAEEWIVARYEPDVGTTITGDGELRLYPNFADEPGNYVSLAITDWDTTFSWKELVCTLDYPNQNFTLTFDKEEGTYTSVDFAKAPEFDLFTTVSFFTDNNNANNGYHDFQFLYLGPIQSESSPCTVRASWNDLRCAYLEDKILAGAGINIAINNEGLDETMTISCTAGSVDLDDAYNNSPSGGKDITADDGAVSIVGSSNTPSDPGASPTGVSSLYLASSTDDRALLGMWMNQTTPDDDDYFWFCVGGTNPYVVYGYLDGTGQLFAIGSLTTDGFLNAGTSTILNNSGGDNDTQIQGQSDANTFYVDASADSVGIGTAAPGEKLHVVGSIRMEDGTEGAGKLLQSDADGTGSWQTISIPSQYTDEMAEDAVGGILTNTGAVDFTYDDAGNIITATITQHETFMDLKALSTNGVYGGLWANGTIVTNFYLDAPRQITWRLTATMGTCLGTLTINGLDANGAAKSEAFVMNIAAPGSVTGNTNTAIVTITTVVISGASGGGSIILGWNDQIGLINYPFNATTDVFAFKKNATPAVVPSVNALYGTISLTTITAGDDFEVWARVNK